MKNKRIFICSILLISSVLFSCKWQVPEKVSVKTNAEYNFSAGNIDLSLNEQLDIKKMLGSNLPANVKVYDYFPGEADANIQRYLIKASLFEVPLDIGSIMSQIDLTSNLKAMEFSKDITVPTVSIPPITQELNINVPNIPGMRGNPDLSGVPGIPEELPDKLPEGLPEGIPGVNPGENPTIPDVPGVTDKPIVLEPASIRLDPILPADSMVKKCAISKGSLGISIDGLNEDAVYKVSLSSQGGLTVAEGSASKGVPIPLNYATITAGETSDISIKIELTNVKSVNNPKITITPVIEGIKSVTVDFGEGIPTAFSKTEKLPKEATDVVESIKLKDSGIVMEYTNTLPASNKIKFNIESKFLGIKAREIELKHGEKQPESIITSALVKFSDYPDGVDFNVGLTLPGAEKDASGEKTKVITVNDVKMGDTYKIGFKITPKLDWEEVKVKPAALNSVDIPAGNIDLGIDLNKILGDVGQNLVGDPTLFTGLSIDKLPVYVVCGKPKGIEAFDNLKFKAKAELKTKNAEGVETSLGYLLGNDKEEAGLKFAESLPELDIDKVVTNDFAKEDVSLKTDLGEAFSKVISTPGNLGLTYSVKADGAGKDAITLNKQQLENAGTTKIALEAYIDLGLALTVPEKGISIDLSKMEGMKDMFGKDIFQGNGKSMKDQGYDAYMKAIEELAITCSVKTLPIHLDKPISLNMKAKNIAGWKLDLQQNHDFVVQLTNEQICNLFDDTKNPGNQFMIDTMAVTIPGGTFSIPRAKNVNTDLKLRLKTDGTIKVWEKGQESNGTASDPSSNGGN